MSLNGGTGRPPLFVSGLRREAAIARGRDAVALCGDRATLRRRLAEIVDRPALVVSFGLCGGLDPALRSGDVVIGTAIAGEDGFCDPAIAETLRSRLIEAGERAGVGALAVVDAPIVAIAEKARLRGATGAAAVDVESAIAAEFAAARGSPFAILRVVSDPADRDLPPLVLTATGPNGETRLGAVVGGLVADPRQIAGLIAAARDSAAAFATLSRCRRLPGLFRGLGLTDLG